MLRPLSSASPDERSSVGSGSLLAARPPSCLLLGAPAFTSALPLPNSAGRIGPSIDVRGDGGYVLAPPSTGPKGRRYEADERAPLAACPVWLLELIADNAGGRRKPTPASEWLAIVREGVEEGKRNEQLARLVGHLLRRYVDVDLVAAIAHLVNDQRSRPSLPHEEVDRIIDSIAAREARRRTRAA